MLDTLYLPHIGTFVHKTFTDKQTLLTRLHQGEPRAVRLRRVGGDRDQLLPLGHGQPEGDLGGGGEDLGGGPQEGGGGGGPGGQEPPGD